MNRSRHVVIVGGGIAGLAAAERLARKKQSQSSDLRITLLESRRATGGRAGSFVEPETGQSVDYCQHVTMGCCTNLLAMLERLNLLNAWQCYRDLTFYHPKTGLVPFAPSRRLPAPFHLNSALGGLSYLTLAQRMRIRWAIAKLMITPERRLLNLTAGDWLAANWQGEPERALFWDVILISALGDRTQYVSMAAARKVIVDGFARKVGACDVWVPRQPLSKVFGHETVEPLRQLGVDVQTSVVVRGIRESDSPGNHWVVEKAGSHPILDADHVILATPFTTTSRILRGAIGENEVSTRLDSLCVSPITGVHLWLDRRLTPLPHVAMVGTVAQWLFCQPIDEKSENDAVYHQVVISGRHCMSDRSKEELIAHVMQELQTAFPGVTAPRLLHHRVVTDPNAVFSITPLAQSLRPQTDEGPRGISLAGDWVQTGWPATMEGAVISGQRAAENAFQSVTSSSANWNSK